MNAEPQSADDVTLADSGGKPPSPAVAARAGGWSFQYKHGDRPLDGYTIQRAAGRGGFGEVYYAVSDAGREVALKVITGFEQIELRGIGQCMNLKSPHLVTIFDVKQNAEGRSFVIMEFVSGMNLRELLDESPAGLGPQKAAFFLREIAKGLSYLHDCGIVHRDLKPANIFFENGYVKIGDYGLSKAIEPTHHSGQTVTVGTVHYMAPEVGAGKYDRSIDIYALGALLYEMLTGIVPFVGASAGEILIKHLSHDADCSGIPEPFCSVIKKAMAKDPAQRYATVQEMVEAVFGAEHVRNSVSQFSPQELSMIAERIAARIPPAVPTSAVRPSPAGGSSVTNPHGLGSPKPGAAPAPEAGFRRIASSLLAPIDDNPAEPRDSLSTGRRLVLGLLAAVSVAIAAQVFAQPRNEDEMLAHTLLAIVGAATGIVLAARMWMTRVPAAGAASAGWADRFALATAGALGAVTLSAPVWLDMVYARRHLAATFVAIVVAFSVVNPRRWTALDRPARIKFLSVLAAAAIALVVAAMLDDDAVFGAIAIVGGAALAVQVVAPWDESRARDDDEDADEVDEARAGGPGWVKPLGAVAPAAAAPRLHASAPIPPPIVAARPPFARIPAGVERPVARGMVITWFCAMLAFTMIGLFVLIGAIGSGPADNDFPGMMAVALSLLSLGGFSFIRLWKRTLTSWWTYLVLPLLRAVCMVVVITVWANLNFDRHLRPWDTDDYLVIMSIFTMLWLLLWLVPTLWRVAIPPAPGAPPPLPPFLYRAGVAVGELRNALHTSAASEPAPGTVEPTAAPDAVTTTPAPVAQRDFAKPVAPAPHRRHRRAGHRERPDLIGGFAGLLSVVLLLASLVLALGAAIDVPTMIEAGVPSGADRDDFVRNMFGPNVKDWPSLMRSVMIILMIVGFTAGTIAMVVARRRGGVGHVVRGLLAVLGVIIAVKLFGAAFRGSSVWPEVGNEISSGLAGDAIETVLTRLGDPACFMPLLTIVCAIVAFAWPRNRRPAQAAIETQKGVAA